MSGKLFQIGQHKAEPILASDAVLVQSAIIEQVAAKAICIPLGSVGKKKDTDYNGDIDIGVKASTLTELEILIKTAFPDNHTIKSNEFYIVSMLYPYKHQRKTKYVSVDFIQVVDEEYTKFRYFCPDYRKNESKYKVGAKIMLAGMILNHCKEKDEGLPNGYYGKYDFSPIGLYRYSINKHAFTDYTKEFITTDCHAIAHIPFKDGDVSHFHSVETLWNAIHSDVFKYPEEVKGIEVNFFINSYRKCWEELVDYHDFKLSDEVVRLIEMKLKEEEQIRKLNQLLDF